MLRTSLNNILLITIGLICLASCSKGYRIEGKSSVTSLDGKMLYLKALQEGDWIVVDSAEMVHGWFKMKGPVDSVRMVTLYMNEEGLMPLVLENGKIKVNISNTQLVAEGTPLNDLLYDFIGRRNEMERAINEAEREEARLVLDGVRLWTLM